MANLVNRSTCDVDTAETLITSGFPCWIRKLTWHPNAADNDLLIEDADGKEEIWRVRATAGAPNNESYGIETKEFSPPARFDGLKITIIDAGTLYVELA